ncbi:hypothetical protein CK203_044219 [Vitis vinifera]|uniref:Uncharacterized protein n=1 Tax=Vitis vinifera TaxID=29760 RepID=A0A438GVE7_VITVI|nr:hypothetical protein CK203_044219 [Vitis vinifera]
MDQQVVTVDQFTVAMASIQELWLASDRRSVVSSNHQQWLRMRHRKTRCHHHRHHHSFGASGLTLYTTWAL